MSDDEVEIKVEGSHHLEKTIFSENDDEGANSRTIEDTEAISMVFVRHEVNVDRCETYCVVEYE